MPKRRPFTIIGVQLYRAYIRLQANRHELTITAFPDGRISSPEELGEALTRLNNMVRYAGPLDEVKVVARAEQVGEAGEAEA